MKIKKQAIFPILMMLVVTALALIGSSFAWFSISNIAKVATIETSAQSADVEFLISNDGDRFYAKNLSFAGIDSSTTLGENGHYVNPGMLYQVSTVGASTDANGLLAFFDASYNGYSVSDDKDYITTGTDGSLVYNNGLINSATGNALETYGEAENAEACTYIAFDLYFYVDRQASIYLYSDSQNNGINTAVESDVEALEKSIRVAFVYLGSLASSTKEVQGGLTPASFTGSKTIVIWEPNHTLEGSDKVLTYGVNAVQTEEFEAYVDGDYTDLQTTYTSEEMIISGADDIDSNTIAVKSGLAAGYHKFRVYVWMEGNDPDCVAAVASKDLTVDLAFFAKAD